MTVLLRLILIASLVIPYPIWAGDTFTPDDLLGKSPAELATLRQKVFGVGGNCSLAAGATSSTCGQLKSFFKVKEKWDSCVAPGLHVNHQRDILSGILTAPLTNSCDTCTSHGGLLGGVKNINELTKSQTLSFMQDAVLGIALKNSTTAYLAVSTTLPGGESKDPLRELVPELNPLAPHAQKAQGYNIVRDLQAGCNLPGKPKFISPGGYQVQEYLRELKAQADKKPTARLSSEQVAQLLNPQVQKMNDALTQVNASVHDGLITNSPELNSDVRKKYKQYEKAYDEAVSSPLGVLMVTGPVEKDVGSFRLLESKSWLSSMLNGFHDDFHAVTVNGKEEYIFTPHTALPAAGPQLDSLVKGSVSSLKQNLAEQTREVVQRIDSKNLFVSGEMHMTDKQIQANASRDLAELSLMNPLAVGQFLAAHPDFAPLYCDIFKDIADTEKNRELFRKGAIWVGGAALVLGVALTGGLLVAGGAVALGLAEEGVMLGILSSGAAIAGNIAVGSAVPRTLISLDQDRAAQAKRRAFLAGNAPASSVREAVTTRDELTHNVELLAQDLAFAGVAHGAGALAANLLKTEKGVRLTLHLAELSDTVKTMARMKVVPAFRTFVKELNPEQSEGFVKLFTRADPEAQAKWLANLKAGKFKPNTLQTLKGCL